MTKTYLYIPFKEEENSLPLEILAEKWRYNLKKSSNKSHDIPTILCHGRNMIPDKFEEGSTIYVLGHGIDSENDDLCHMICNIRDTENESSLFTLSMTEVANRLLDDGLTPDKPAKLKLYFCNETGKTQEMAEEFIATLGKDFSHSKTTVDYYTTEISNPTLNRATNAARKLAYRSIPIATHDGTYQKKSVWVGFASDHRKRIQLNLFSQTLQEPPSSCNDIGTSKSPTKNVA